MAARDRLQRVLDLWELLQTGRVYNASDLAAHFEVSRRTIFRDLNTLGVFGIDVERTRQPSGYRLNPSQALPTADLNWEEAFSLLLLCDELADQTHGVPFHEAARSAAVKLLKSLPKHVQDRATEMRRLISVRLGPHNTLSQSGAVYQTLTDALMKRRQTELVYQGPLDPQPALFVVCPYHILFKNRSWYLIADSRTHEEIRTFNLGRIRSAKMLPESYSISSSFRLDRYIGEAWSLIREPDQRHEVTVRFQPRVAQNVAEVQWHSTQKMSWNDDGTMDYTVTVEGLNEIRWWILGYGDQAKVLSPPELQTAIRECAERIRRNYEPD